MSKTPTTLIIMDGFGMASAGATNAVSVANTPVMDRLFAEYAHTTLSASGLDVGLPEGQMGNSEVGHTNIGAGRIVYQPLMRITNAVRDGSFFENEALCSAMENCKETAAKNPNSIPITLCFPKYKKFANRFFHYKVLL